MVLAGIGIKELPSKSVILVEEELGPVKSIFAQRTAFNMVQKDKKVLYITYRSKKEILEEMDFFQLNIDEGMNILGEFRDNAALVEVVEKEFNGQSINYYLKNNKFGDIFDFDVCIIDTFSYFFIDTKFDNLLSTIESMMDSSRKNSIIFILTTDMGIIPEKGELALRSLVDGVVQFRSTYTGNKLIRYINIPKMRGVLPMDQMMPYKVTSEGIVLDVRERVG